METISETMGRGDAAYITRLQVENVRLEYRLLSIGGTLPEKLRVAEWISDRVAEELDYKIKLLEAISAKAK